MDLLRSSGEAKAVRSKTVADMVELALGRLRPGAKMKARAKVRAKIAAKEVRCGRDASTGVLPFPAVAARSALRAARGRKAEKLQGGR